MQLVLSMQHAAKILPYKLAAITGLPSQIAYNGWQKNLSRHSVIRVMAPPFNIRSLFNSCLGLFSYFGKSCCKNNTS